MLSGFHRAGLSRVAAALVSLALTGAPELAAALAPAPAHRCQCARGAGHECSCPHCAAAAGKERAPKDGGLPPCHRFATPTRQAKRSRSATAACVSTSCGAPEARLAPRSGIEAFIIPEPPAALLSPPLGDVVGMHHVPCCRREKPETPPPRSA